jgi:sugar lactone lactonase YvrE
MARKLPSPSSRTLALTALALSACAAPQRPEERVVWPFPPEKARIEYVRTIANGADVEAGSRRFWASITGKTPLGMQTPTAVALSPDGQRLYVSCSSIGTVLMFDFENGRAERAATAEGFKPKRPFGLAVDGEGNLYVGDQGEGVVWVYDKLGKPVRRIGPGMFTRTVGLAFDVKRQQLYVVDGSNGVSENHRVEVFAPDGRHIRTIGKRGAGPGEFNFPTFVAVAPDGRVFVADTGNFRVQVFSPDGELLTSFGAAGGDAPGLFDKMKGMAFDSLGNLYVVDGMSAIVQMFSASFKPLMHFGGNAARPGFMSLPNGIAIDSHDNIFVSDYGMHHVNQYRLINTTAADLVEPGPSAPPLPASGAAPQPAAAIPPPPPPPPTSGR